MQTSPAVEEIKNVKGPRVRRISPVGKEKVYGGNDLPKSQVLSSEWKTERVREDASGDSEDGEEDDDELPCVIGEGEGKDIVSDEAHGEWWWWVLWHLWALGKASDMKHAARTVWRQSTKEGCWGTQSNPCE